jgi:hypothetical protein
MILDFLIFLYKILFVLIMIVIFSPLIIIALIYKMLQKQNETNR